MTTYIPSLTLPAQVFSKPAVAILLPIALGTGIGFAITPKAQTQSTYLALKQPPLRPPPWVFGPVWTVLYGLIGYSSYRAWNTGISSFNPQTIELTKQSATLYTIQLGLNLIYMPLFFKLKRPIEATVDIAALTGTTAYLTYIYSQIDSVAAWGFAPYLGWLTFATYLSVRTAHKELINSFFAGTGYLNNWDISDKEVQQSPLDKTSDTKYVNEAPETKKAL